MSSVVLDLNILISALIKRGSTSRRVVEAWVAGRYQLLFAVELLDDLRSVVERPRLRKYFSHEAGVRLITRIVESADFVVPQTTMALCRDPKDNILLDVAIAGEADYLVTGDGDLLDDEVLKRIMLTEHGVRVVRVTEFLSILDLE
jgi:hypothetical protein